MPGTLGLYPKTRYNVRRDSQCLPPMEKLKTEIRQEQIIHAALALIAEKGLKQLAVAPLARRVGLVPSAIYRHFKGKDEIIDGVLNFVEQGLISNVDAVSAKTQDSVERLRLLLAKHAQFIRENRAIPRVIFSEEVYGASHNHKAKVALLINRYLARIEAIIRQGQSRKEIRTGIDPSTLAVLFLGLIQPAAILWHLSDGDFDVTRHTRQAWKAFRRILVDP